MTEQPDLLSWRPPDPYPAKGDTFDQERDGKRLNAQCQRVYNVLANGEWHTLKTIELLTHDPQASISARLRDLRRFGFTIEREHVSDGLWKYRMLP